MSIRPYSSSSTYSQFIPLNDENFQPPELSSSSIEEPSHSSSTETTPSPFFLAQLYCDETFDASRFSSSSSSSSSSQVTSSAPITYSPQKPSASEISATRKRLERPSTRSFLSRLAESAQPSSSDTSPPEVWTALDNLTPGSMAANLTDLQFSIESKKVYETLSKETPNILESQRYHMLAKIREKNASTCYTVLNDEIFGLEGPSSKQQRKD